MLIIAAQAGIVTLMFIFCPSSDGLLDVFAAASVAASFSGYYLWFRQFTAAVLFTIAGFILFVPLTFLLLMTFGGHHW